MKFLWYLNSRRVYCILLSCTSQKIQGTTAKSNLNKNNQQKSSQSIQKDAPQPRPKNVQHTPHPSSTNRSPPTLSGNSDQPMKKNRARSESPRYEPQNQSKANPTTPNRP